VEARLRDDGLARRHVGQQLVGALDVDLEAGQVAVVDPDHVGVGDLERAGQLVLVVDLDQHVEVQRGRLRVQLGSSAGRNAATMSRIASAPRPPTRRPVGVDDEVLAQDRQRARGARLADVVQRPAEVRALGQDESAAAPPR
jgi:hypothetical protein